MDVIAAQIGGMVLSASGDYQLSAALGVHPFLQLQHPSAAFFTLYWNAETRRYENMYTDGTLAALQMNRTDILRNLSNRALLALDGAESSIVDNVFNIHLPQYNIRTTLPLNKQEVFLFFAEIEYLRNLVDALKTDSSLLELVKDSLPDIFSFAFSSLKGIMRTYGEDSDQLRAALYILDGTLTSVIEEMSQLYQEKLTVEVVFLGVTSYSSLHQDIKARGAVYKVVANEVNNKESFDAYFPTIYLRDQRTTEQMCSTLQNRLPADLKVNCPARRSIWLRQDNNSNGTTPTNSTDAAAFQVILWSAVLLILIIYGAIYALYTMDTGADSLLYRMTGSKHHVA
jgi:hypothetical protein